MGSIFTSNLIGHLLRRVNIRKNREMTSGFRWLKCAWGFSQRKAKPHLSFDQKAQRTVRLHSSCPFPHTHTQTVILPSHKKHMSKTLSTKTTTRGQDQHIPARPYGESKSITHAQTPTQALLAFTPQTHRPKHVHINARENVCLKYFNYPLVWNSYF